MLASKQKKAQQVEITGQIEGAARTSDSRKVQISGCPVESAASGKSGIPLH
jgi:hypothetical protein